MREPRSVTSVDGDPVAQRPMEFVERKGIGHPDSLCDGVAEAVSRRLARFYREEFGRVRHHNTDQVYLGAGQSEPAYGGGAVVEPIYVLVGGQATTTVGDRDVPVDELATSAAREYLLDTVPAIESAHLDVESRIGQPSRDLASLYRRGTVPLANDTSFGVGHAPGTPTEQFVRTLTPRLHTELDAVGKDVKVMARRDGGTIHLAIAAAVLGRHVSSLAEYREVIARIEALAEQHAADTLSLPVSIRVNAADDYKSELVYLTATGLSAEAGDDGSVGRGNRANGLITPQRPMSLEATAGKNPVTHVGKLYNLLALRIATRLASDLDASYSGVQLLSRIGEPVSEPVATAVVTTVEDEAAVHAVVDDERAHIPRLTDALVEGTVDVF